MRKILHLIPTLEGGGAERQLSMLASEQAQRGHDVHICARRGGAFAAAPRACGVTIHLLGEHRGSLNVFLWLKIFGMIKRVMPDIVQTWLTQMDITGGSAALWNSVPWIVSERTSRGAFSRQELSWSVRSWLVRYADAIVANSEDGASYWREKLATDSRVFRIRNAVDVDAVRSSFSPFFRESRFNDKKLVLVVGGFRPEKAHEIVVQALRLVPDRYPVHVFMIGEGALQHEIEAMVSAAELSDRCSLIPFMSDWWGLLGDASVLVNVSRFEGHPNVVLEAIAGGCPLIVSDIPAHREFLDEGTAVLVLPDDPAALANAIVSVLSKPEEARQRAERATAIVEVLRVSTAADAYASLYESIIGGAPD
jgi:glycosyltransferase involved in cell wall biosynthesis